MASLHLTRYPGPVSRAKTSIARGLGATGKGVGVLHMGGGFVQYARPLASRSPPSWSGAVRGRCPGLSGRRATARRQRGNQKGPGRSQAAGDEGAQPHDQDLTRPRGIEHVSSPVSTALTSGVPPSKPQRESLEFQGSSPARNAGAGLMSAPWTPALHQAAVNDPLLSRP